MIALESISPGLSLTGLDPTGIGSVIAVVPIADGAVQVLYRTPDGAIKERLLNRADEASISIATTERPWSFDGDGEAFKLTVEAKREERLTKTVELENAFKQARCYAMWTGCRHCLVTDGKTVILYRIGMSTLEKESELIRFEREELDTARLKAGEHLALVSEHDRLVHAQALQEFAAGAANRLYDEDGSIVEHVGRMHKEAQQWAGLDSDLADVARRLESLAVEIRDIAETCRDLSERFEADPARLGEVEKRIQQLRRLEAKYRKSIDELRVYREELDRKQDLLSRDESDVSGIDNELRQAFAELESTAMELSKSRAKVGKKLVAETQKHLVKLGMPTARLGCGLEPIPLGTDPFEGDVPIGGADSLEFLLAANPGEPFRPLRKVASGGEMSRTMLALKTVLAEHDPVGTLVFDEIDANVGGRLGDIVGEKLALLGRTHQVICVTHLPQVAVYSKHQWTIRKFMKAKRTSTTITPLNSDEERLEEIASMMRGEARGETTRKEAAEMLKTARKKW